MALANFIREGATTASLLVNFSVGGTATFATDYTVTFPPGVIGTWGATTGSVTLPIGTSQVDITVTPTADGVLESDETVVVTITSTTPPISISSSNNAAVLVILNDDFVTLLKILGVGTSGTTLVGTSTGALNTVNTGTAPANWTSWAVSTGTTAVITSTLASPTDISTITLMKFVIRSPSIATAAGTLRLGIAGSTTSQFFLRWDSNGAGYDLKLLFGTTVIFVFPNYTLSQWVDVIIEITPAGTTMVVDGTLTQFTNTVTIAVSTLLIRNAVGGFAAAAVTKGLKYAPSMFPITPANL